MNLIVIIFASIFTSNIALTFFLGMCPFITISKKLDVAIGMGIAVTFVMTVTAAANWLIFYKILSHPKLNLEYLQFLVFIISIATIVQILEIIIDRYFPKLYYAFGIFLPLITVNCAILGISLFMVLRSQSFVESVTYAFGSGMGWTLAIVTMGALRKKLVFSKPLSDFGDAGITSIIAGIMALGFIGFSGIGGL